MTRFANLSTRKPANESSAVDCCRVVATVIGNDETRMEAPRNSTYPHVIDEACSRGTLTLTSMLVVLVEARVFSFGRWLC